jgi:hypothetical protein
LRTAFNLRRTARPGSSRRTRPLCMTPLSRAFPFGSIPGACATSGTA